MQTADAQAPLIYQANVGSTAFTYTCPSIPQLNGLSLNAAADLAASEAEIFRTLVEAWHSEYGASSSPIVITRCPSYQAIIGLGRRMLPFIFRDLEQQPEPDHWFEALRRITQIDPVLARERGNHRRMAKAWLKWGRAKGYA